MAAEAGTGSGAGHEGKRADSHYDASSIRILKGLEGVRKRPAMYIGDTGKRGLHHILEEIVDNSIDEHLAGYCRNITVVIHPDNSATVDDDGRGIPVDIHPDVGRPALEIVLTSLHSGGKFDAKSYRMAGGLHGVGVSVTNALSEWMEVRVMRDGKIYSQKYARGIPLYDMRVEGEVDTTGTSVTFKPDPEMFSELEFDYDLLAKRLEELSFLNSGLKVNFSDERTGKSVSFIHEGGIKSYVKDLNKTKSPIHAEPVYLCEKEEKYELEIAMQYTDGYLGTVYSFVNGINTIEGGTHEEGWRTAVTRALNKYLGEKETLQLKGEDVREGLTAVISMRLQEPQFEGQTKTKLGNTEVRGIVAKAVYEKLTAFLEENPAVRGIIMTKTLEAAKAREAARKAKELVRRKSAFGSGSLPGKLADCQSRESDKTEIFIVEGDSAGGCFSGDTEVALVDGRNLTFSQLVEEDRLGKRNHCYTVKKDGSMGTGVVKYPRITRRNADVMKLVLNNGKEITCTPNHPFMLSDGSYVRADALTEKSDMMPLQKVSETCGIHVKRAERTGQMMDVYDFEVEGTHNFALASGIFVHNSSKQGRDRRFQAILPLRGKILNTEKARLDKIYENNEISAMMTAIGTGIHEECDPAKSRYGKVIIMADSDVDGNHIVTLVLTFFYRYMKPMIDAGKIYVANAPLYRIKQRGEVTYVFNDKEKDEYMLKVSDAKGVLIQRFKGLGEMNPEQLWETTLDPATRVLKQITIQDAMLADSIFSTLMGTEVEPRKDFIMAHSGAVKNLDV